LEQVASNLFVDLHSGMVVARNGVASVVESSHWEKEFMHTRGSADRADAPLYRQRSRGRDAGMEDWVG
jgi:hypothetical protein